MGFPSREVLLIRVSTTLISKRSGPENVARGTGPSGLLVTQKGTRKKTSKARTTRRPTLGPAGLNDRGHHRDINNIINYHKGLTAQQRHRHPWNGRTALFERGSAPDLPISLNNSPPGNIPNGDERLAFKRHHRPAVSRPFLGFRQCYLAPREEPKLEKMSDEK